MIQLCECGCGQPAPIATKTYRRHGHIAGQPVRFCVGHNGRRAHTRSRYVMVQAPWHPRAGANKQVQEHILVAEAALGHFLPSGAEVHHVDENKKHNANRNLVICQDAAYHKMLHVRMRIVARGGNPNTERICSTCKQIRPLSAFGPERSNLSHGLQFTCRRCPVLRARAKAIREEQEEDAGDRR